MLDNISNAFSSWRKAAELGTYDAYEMIKKYCTN